MHSVTKGEIKDIKSLQSKKGRSQKKSFCAEGVRLLEEALRHGFLPQRVYQAPALLSERGGKLVRDFMKKGVQVSDLSARQIDMAGHTKTSAGLLAVFAIPVTNPAELQASVLRRILLCDNIADPGNLGTLLRSALAFGFEAVLLTGSTADVYNPKVVRASAGALFGLTVVRLELTELVELLDRHRVMLAAADVRGVPMPVRPRRWRSRSLAVAVGAEATGVSTELTSRADQIWSLEQAAGVESLNVAVAGSIIMNRLWQADQES